MYRTHLNFIFSVSVSSWTFLLAEMVEKSLTSETESVQQMNDDIMRCIHCIQEWKKHWSVGVGMEWYGYEMDCFEQIVSAELSAFIVGNI